MHVTQPSPGSLSHLSRRFLDVLTSKPLSISERAAVDSWLVPEMAEVFFEQMDADQRHCYHAALSVISNGHNDGEVITAALVHDVGKRHAHLGVIGRSIASVMIFLGLPLTERMLLYRDHGRNGARELVELGAPSLAVEFALHHQGKRPQSIEIQLWKALVAADQAPKARTSADF